MPRWWPFGKRNANKRGVSAPVVAIPRKRASATTPYDEQAPPRPFDRSYIPVLRRYAISDEDVAGAVRDLIVLANPGFRITATGRDAERALVDVQANADSWFPMGSLDGFIDNQILELVVAGASSAEWYPTPSRDGVAGVAIIPAEQVRVEVDQKGNVKYYQASPTGDIELNPMTYFYFPSVSVANSRIGVPIIFPALAALPRKEKMLQSIDRLLDLLGLAGIVHAGVPLPDPVEEGFSGETDPEWHEWVRARLQTVADLLMGGQEKGVIVTPAGTEVSITSPSRELSLASTAWTDNEFRVWSGARTMPFMRGRSETLSETWARVVYPIILAEAENIRLIVAQHVERGLNLHLRLRGYMASVRVEFREPASPFRESNARANFYEARTDEIYAQLFGEAWLDRRRKELGLI